ncbi:hypothetical protein ACH4TX_11800 [Streptomyces sp. NPDC021098]|uniref:hypothetical protein n=1 Tax=unclassified Streptomyces TaxID=2593676 RepID=UPI0037A2388D
MAEFLRTAPGLLAVLFGVALLVVAGYRLVRWTGGVGVGARGGDGARADTAGPPFTAVVVTGIALAWGVALAGDALPDRPWLRIAVLPAVAGAGWVGVRLQRRLNHRLQPAGPLREQVVGRRPRTAFPRCAAPVGTPADRRRSGEHTTNGGS